MKLFNTVNRKALLIVSFIFLLSFLLILSSFWFKGSMRQVYNLIDHANEVEISLREILFTIKDCESDIRAYVITNDESFFENFSNNRTYVHEKTRDLKAFMNDSLQVGRCIYLEGLLIQRLRTLEGMGHFSDTLHLQEFQQAVRQGELISDKIEQHVAAMIAYEKKVLADQESRLFSLMAIRRAASIFGGLLAIGLSIYIFKLIREESAMTQRKQELLQELNNNKDRFFSIISHDLRNPFTAIKGFIEILDEHRHNKKSEGTDEIIKMLKASSDRFERLLTDLLTWAQLQMNALTAGKEIINLSLLLQDVTEQYHETLQLKNLSLEIHADKSLFALADKSMTGTILRNLIGNAVKFTDQGTITLTAARRNKQAMIEVSDTGTGIDQEVLQNLFKLGKVKSQKGTKNETGTGMGLILCKEMAERQGGTLEISSAPSTGTTVKVFLPMRS